MARIKAVAHKTQYPTKAPRKQPVGLSQTIQRPQAKQVKSRNRFNSELIETKLISLY